MPKVKVLTVIIAVLLTASCAINIDRYRQAMPVGMTTCADCHLTEDDGSLSDRGQKLIGTVDVLCTGCHAERIAAGEHRVGMVQQRKTVLPLYDGRVECPTCHEPHGLEGNRFILRLPMVQICRSCHDK